jgi:hypothetical protein
MRTLRWPGADSRIAARGWQLVAALSAGGGGGGGEGPLRLLAPTDLRSLEIPMFTPSAQSASAPEQLPPAEPESLLGRRVGREVGSAVGSTCDGFFLGTDSTLQTRPQNGARPCAIMHLLHARA